MEQSVLLASVLEWVTPGTGKWLLEDEKVISWKDGSGVHRWMKPDGATDDTIKKLWLYGHAGSGKTYAAATMVNHLLSNKEAHVGICYYFCAKLAANVEALSILKTLVKQVAQSHEDAKTEYEQSTQQQAMPECNWTDHERFDETDALHCGMLLVSLSKKFNKVFMVIDHLDMLPPQLLQLIASLVDIEGSTLRSMFTTGDGPGQQKLCMETMSCPIGVKAYESDVQLYIRQQLNATQDESTENQDLIEKFVVRRADGHWSSAVADFANRYDLLRRGLSIDENTGLTLFDIYDNHILRMMRGDTVSKFILLRAVRLVCAAHQYPDIILTGKEMCHVLAVLLQDEELIESSDSVNESQITYACCYLLRKSTTLDSFQYVCREVHNYIVEHLKSYPQPLKQLHFERKTYKIVFDELGKAGSLLARQHPAIGESVLRKMHTSYSNAFGISDADTLNVLRRLADLYGENGRFGEAETTYKTVMQSEDKIAALEATNALAILYKRHQMFSEAETHYQKAIVGYQELNDQRAADKISGNLALMYAAKGEHSQARQIWGRLLETSQNADDPMMRYNYALTFKLQGVYEVAAPLLEESLAKYEKFYGDKARETADVAESLAEVYASQRRLAEAEMLFKRVSAIHNANGEQASQLETKHALAKVWREQNRIEEAKALLEQILATCNEGEGWGMPAVRVGLTLYFLLEDMGRLEEAATLGERVVAGFETHMGREDESTASTADCLALTYAKLEQLEDAERMWKLALEGYKAVKGDEHVLTCAAAHNLGLVYTKQKRNEDARQMLKFALVGYQNDEKMRVRLLHDLDTVKKPAPSSQSIQSIKE